MNLKPERKILVRILDLKSGQSKNFSIYDDVELDHIYKLLKKYLEKIKK